MDRLCFILHFFSNNTTEMYSNAHKNNLRSYLLVDVIYRAQVDVVFYLQYLKTFASQVFGIQCFIFQTFPIKSKTIDRIWFSYGDQELERLSIKFCVRHLKVCFVLMYKRYHDRNTK